MGDSDTYTVQRSTTVQTPPGRLFEQVEDFHRWPALRFPDQAYVAPTPFAAPP